MFYLDQPVKLPNPILHIIINVEFQSFFSEKPSPMRGKSNDIYYYIIKKSLTFTDGRSFCGTHFPKGDLAEIDTTQKINAIKRLIIASYGRSKNPN